MINIQKKKIFGNSLLIILQFNINHKVKKILMNLSNYALTLI